jgi:hypothetical protein
MKDQDTSTLTELEMEMERLTCQMKALIRAKWPEKFNVKRADLNVVASTPEPQSSNSSEVIREINRRARMDQLKALLDEKWGPVQKETPKPKVDRVMVDRLKGMIRSTWPEEFGRHTNVVQFPRAKKRGAKRKSGPCADIIQFEFGTSGLSKSEKYVFDEFVSCGKSKRWARAVVEHLRLPVTETRHGGVRGGVLFRDFLDRLAAEGV